MKDFMFDPELMDQLSEIAYIGEHFHLSGRKLWKLRLVFIKKSGSNDLVCEELNDILFIDREGF